MVNETATAALNWVDYIILVIMALSTLVGIFRGFIKEAVSLLVWVVAIFVAIKFFSPLGQYVNKHYIDSLIVSNVVAFVGLFIVTLILGLIINVIISLLIEKTGLTATDRLLGIVFGLVRGVLLVALLIMFVNLSAFRKNKVFEQSKLVSAFEPVATWLSKFLPKGLEYAMNAVEPPSSSHASSRMTREGAEQTATDQNS
jgi:membrane protein required for colicin V production